MYNKYRYILCSSIIQLRSRSSYISQSVGCRVQLSMRKSFSSSELLRVKTASAIIYIRTLQASRRRAAQAVSILRLLPITTCQVGDYLLYILYTGKEIDTTHYYIQTAGDGQPEQHRAALVPRAGRLPRRGADRGEAGARGGEARRTVRIALARIPRCGNHISVGDVLLRNVQGRQDVEAEAL